MGQGQRRFRPEFWIILIFVALVAYALIADWWKEHEVLGRVVVGVVVALLAVCLWRFPTFRARLVTPLKTAIDGLIRQPPEPTEPTPARGPESVTEFTPVRPLTQRDRDLFFEYIGHRCEKPNCRESNVHNIHHITPRQEGGRHDVWDLIVLCPTHHEYADNKIPPRSRQRHWAGLNKKARRRLLDSGKWKYQ
jgi:hypothetical protein